MPYILGTYSSHAIVMVQTQRQGRLAGVGLIFPNVELGERGSYNAYIRTT